MNSEQFPAQPHEALTTRADSTRKDLEGYAAAYIDPNGPVSVNNLEYTYQDRDGQPAVGKADVLAVVVSGPTAYGKTFAVAALENGHRGTDDKRFGLLQIDPLTKASKFISEITTDENVAERAPLIGRKTGDRYRPGELFTYNLMAIGQAETPTIQIRNRSLSGSTVYTARPEINSERPIETRVVHDYIPRHRRKLRVADHVARILTRH